MIDRQPSGSPPWWLAYKNGGQAELTDVTSLIDVIRYPLTDLGAPVTQSVILAARRALAERGVATLPGFLRPETITAMAREGLALRSRAHLENIYGPLYPDGLDDTYPEGHPRRGREQSRAWMIAYDLIPSYSPLRALYEWDSLLHFVGEILERRPLYRSADRLDALHLMVMTSGHQQGWHYAPAEFIACVVIQGGQGGGRFEAVPFIRTAEEENYDEVAQVLRGEARHRVEVLPMTAGTLMLFAGRDTLHRITAVQGGAPHVVAQLAYETDPQHDSPEALKKLRYGRTQPLQRPR